MNGLVMSPQKASKPMVSRHVVRQPAHRQVRKQRGMTLLVGLVLLLMLTVIGTIGFRNTTMTERMTGNTVDRNVSFQAAESAGREAVTVVEATGTTALSYGVGVFATPFSQGATTNFWNQGQGATVSTAPTGCSTTTPFSWKSCAKAVTAKYKINNGDADVDISEKAQYVIEVLGSVPQPAPSTCITTTFRITSRSTGGSGLAEVVLQSVYLKNTGTCP